ncbi:MAG: LysR family transcriptional regulator [Clostridiales bacterium]|nr:LysR family transcriptional regulator [Clostridiales bacterium]
MNVNFDKILYFLKAAERLNFSQAANELYISSQALNKQIAALENEYGEKLFSRTTRSVQLTEFGSLLKNQMQPVKALYDNAQNEVLKYLRKSEKQLRIVFFVAISKRYILLPIVNELMVRLPGVRVELEAAEMDETIQAVRNGKADLAITNFTEFERCDDLAAVTLATMPASIVISLYHPWMVRESVSKEDMEAMPILLLARDKEDEPDSFYSRIKASGYHKASNYNALLATLEIGKDYAVFPKMFEEMNEFSFRYFDLPEEYRFNCSRMLLFRKDSIYRELFEALNTVVDEAMKNINRF